MSFWGGQSAREELDPKYGNPWDYVVLGGEQLPGICRVRGSFSRKVDAVASPGRDGGTLTDLGYQPASIEITMTIWTEDHWRAWEAMLPRLRPRPGKGIGKALDITHPATTAAGIRSVYITQVALPQPGDAVGAMTVSIQCIEYRKSTPAPPATPQRSQTSLATVPTVTSTSPASTPDASMPFSGGGSW